MNNQELITEFNKVVTSNNRTVSKRYTRSYFDKQGKAGVWDTLFNQTSFLNVDCRISHRLFCIQNNITEFNVCSCGKGHQRIVGDFIDDLRVSEHCSIECARGSDSRGNKISASWKNVDKNLANEKRSVTMKEKYGVEFNSQRDELSHVWKRSKLISVNPEALKLLKDFDWMYAEYITKKNPATAIAKKLGVDYSTVLLYAIEHGFEIRRSYNKSFKETEVFEFVQTIDSDAIQGDRNTINPKEIDIISKHKKIAIEFDGIYYHSYTRPETSDQINLHLRKTIQAKQAGYKLIHVYENEWDEKPDIVKSIISNLLGQSNKIHARKCIIKPVSKSNEKDFLNDNHIQGFSASSICFGLYFQDELVQLMSFGKPRFNKKYDYELIRLCNKKYTSVVGGASKLFKNFKKQFDGSIICYADRRYGDGGVYPKMGFALSHYTKPGYDYTDMKFVYPRYKFQKAKLKNILKVFDEKLSESANMFANGYGRIWNCGQVVYIIEA